MSKFHYCSSEDELRWYIRPAMELKYIRMAADQLSDIRVDIREWADNASLGDVVVWNEVTTPSKGEESWHKKVTPQGNARIYFFNEKDAVFFALKWQ